MIVYQNFNSVGADAFDSNLYTDFFFVPHLHRHFEIAFVAEGETVLTLDATPLTLQEGDAALILPDRIHGYHTPAHSRVWVSVFSSDLIPDAASLTAGRTLERCVFHPSDALRAYALPYLTDASASSPGVRARLAALCADCLENTFLLPAARQEELPPARRLLEYTSLHFREDITLRTAADALGYDAGYLSRCFHRMTGLNFRRFLNACRVEHARRLIRSGALSMTEAAMESGFQSVRTFNRAFLEQTGRPPGGQNP